MCIYATLSFAFQFIGFGRFLDANRNIDAILFHGDRTYLHALTNEMVPDTDTLCTVSTTINFLRVCNHVLEIKLVILPLKFPLSYLHTNTLQSASQ